MFDTAQISVRGGDGGDGAVSFRHEKYVPFGGPDGGDGGNGGSVILVADAAVSNLLSYRRRRWHQASQGGHGQGSKKHGRRGTDLRLKVPAGTMVTDAARPIGDNLVADLESAGDTVVVARGGRGGRGNARFSSATNQAPRVAEKGEPGEERSLALELRLIADVGIIGYPNAGKSTLLSAASGAKPRVADYPFTTKEPVVGVVEVGMETFVLAEIPGLIAGAHAGRGLGHDFLRHAERTRVFIHVVDGSSSSPGEDVGRVNVELGLFDTRLARRPQLVAVNKIDLYGVRERLTGLLDGFSSAGMPAVAISAATGEGVAELMERAHEMLRQTRQEADSVPEQVFRPQGRRPAVSVTRDNGVFVVRAPALERLVAREHLASPGMRPELNRQLARLGINRALARAGASPGDRVRCGDLEWEW